MSIRQGDLKYMVSNVVSIDEYTSKIDDDNITIAFFANQLDVVSELRDLIEKDYYIEIRDIEIADTMTTDNKYILFVEFERNDTFVDNLIDIVDTVSMATDEKKWYFQTIGLNNKLPLSAENLQKYIRLTEMEGKSKKLKTSDEKVDENFAPIVLNDQGWNRKYIPEGYITSIEMEKCISQSMSINSRDNAELKLLETSFPGYDVITTDSNVFLIKGDKILKLS